MLAFTSLPTARLAPGDAAPVARRGAQPLGADELEAQEGIDLAAGQRLHRVEVGAFHLGRVQEVGHLLGRTGHIARLVGIVLLGVEQFLGREKLGQGHARGGGAHLHGGIERRRHGPRLAGIGRGEGRADQDVVDRAAHGRGRPLLIGRSELIEGADLVLVVDQVGPFVIDERNPAPRVRRVDLRRVGVAHEARHGGGDADLVEIGVLGVDSRFHPHRVAQPAALLLDEQLDARAVLLDERGRDLGAHASPPSVAVGFRTDEEVAREISRTFSCALTRRRSRPAFRRSPGPGGYPEEIHVGRAIRAGRKA